MAKKLDFFGVNKKSNVPLNSKPFQPLPRLKNIKNNSVLFNKKPLKIKSVLTTNRVPLYTKKNIRLYGDADFDGSPNKWDCSWKEVHKDGLLSDLWDKTKSMFKKKDENVKVIPKKKPETSKEKILRETQVILDKDKALSKAKFDRKIERINRVIPITPKGIYQSVIGGDKLISSGVELKKVKVINPETGKEEMVMREIYNPKRAGTYRERAREKSNVIQGRLLLGVNTFMGAGRQIAPPPKAVYIGGEKVRGGIGGRVGRPRKADVRTKQKVGRPSGPSGQYRINGRPVGVYEWRAHQRKQRYIQKFGGPSVASENIPDYESQQMLDESQQQYQQPEQQIDPAVLEQLRQQEELQAAQQLPYTDVEYQKRNPYVNDPQYQRQLEEKQMMEEQLLQQAQMEQMQQYAINQQPASRMNIPTQLNFRETMAPAPDINRGDLIQDATQPMAQARSNISQVSTRFKI